MNNLDEITPVDDLPDETNGEWNQGPDNLMPADSYFSKKLDQPVLLRSKDIDKAKYPIISIYTAFKQTVDKNPSFPALAHKIDNQWVYFTYEEYWKMCIKAAKSFIKIGLEKSNCVTIMGFNAPQWFISNLGAIFAGGVGCGIYTTNSAEACELVFRDCKSSIVVVENKQQLDKVLKCIQNGVTIKKIIQYTGEVVNNLNGLVISWSEFIDYGKDVNDELFNQRIKSIAPNKCALLIYTSGTTGSPKAAMLSHDNVSYLIRNMAIDQSRLRFFEERFVSYLPLSHIAAQSIDIYAAIYIGATVYFAQPDALRGSLAQTLKEARPTFFFGVPRVWEKIQEQISKQVATLTGTKLKLLNWASNAAYERYMSIFNQNSKFSFSYCLGKLLVLNKIYENLGLDKCRSFHSGAAPITQETLEFFIRLGIPLTETYGMSESCGPHSVGTVYANKVTSVGPLDQYNRSKVINKDLEGSGELCLYGRHLFMGYLNDEQKTKDTYGEDGWLHTGDIAKIDADGYIFITGRLKELVITAGGENIAPVPIEDKIKQELSKCVSNCILIGDKKKYLVVLICLKSKIDPNTSEPLDELSHDCIEWVRSIGSNSTKVSEIINHQDELVYKEIENGIKRANDYSTSRAAKVQKFEILSRDFSITTGELGPTLKLRRPIVMKMYADVIEKLYSEDNKNE